MSTICPHCGKTVEESTLVACPYCKKPFKDSLLAQLFRKLQRLKWTAEHLILPIIVSVTVLFIGTCLLSPQSLPEIDSTVVYNTGIPVGQSDGPIKLDWEADKTPWLTLAAVNQGDAYETDLDVEIRFKSNNKINNITKTYVPISLERKVQDSKRELSTFYENLSVFPTDSAIEYKFVLDSFITSPNEFEYSLLSHSRNWSRETKIEPQQVACRVHFGGVAYATESASPEINDTNDVEGTTAKGGLLIGGYNPLVMANEIFLLLQRKGLMSRQQALQVKKTLSKQKKGLLLGGINILKFDELILNSLLSTSAISLQQAKEILSKSKNGKGVLVGGYNIIRLQVEILNVLIKNKKITIKEGQAVVDRSKHKVKKEHEADSKEGIDSDK